MELFGKEKLTDASLSTVYENGESGVPFMNAINTEPGKLNKYCYPFFSLSFFLIPLLSFSLLFYNLPFGSALESDDHEGTVQSERGSQDMVTLIVTFNVFITVILNFGAVVDN